MGWGQTPPHQAPHRIFTASFPSARSVLREPRYGRGMGLIALIAHDEKKPELLELTRTWMTFLLRHDLIATLTTGNLLRHRLGLDVDCALSGPHGGDLQIGAMVAAGDIDAVIFLRDPLTPHAHDPDIQALMKVCDVHRVPLATNRATAELCLSALSTSAWPSQHLAVLADDD